MLRLTSQIDKIRELRAQNTHSSLTYAALEIRLAIEMVCYQLLRISYGFISQKDLRAWQPGRVLDILIDEIDPAIVEEKIVWMSAGRNPDGLANSDDSSTFDGAESGARYGIDPQYLNLCWHAVSDFLHIKAPKSSQDDFEYYRPENKIRDSIDEILRELERIDSGILVSTGPNQELSFACECGTINRRRVRFLKTGGSVSCSNADCSETWQVAERDGHFELVPLTVEIRCQDPTCGQTILLHQRPILEMNNRTTGRATCLHCGSENLFHWRLHQVQVVDHARV